MRLFLKFQPFCIIRSCQTETSLVVEWLRTHLAKKKQTKNPPSNAGDMGLIPGQGTEIPYATEPQPTSHNQRVHTPQQKVLSDATTIPMPQLRPTAAK